MTLDKDFGAKGKADVNNATWQYPADFVLYPLVLFPDQRAKFAWAWALHFLKLTKRKLVDTDGFRPEEANACRWSDLKDQQFPVLWRNYNRPKIKDLEGRSLPDT